MFNIFIEFGEKTFSNVRKEYIPKVLKDPPPKHYILKEKSKNLQKNGQKKSLHM
jgi:hypothetical protein